MKKAPSKLLLRNGRHARTARGTATTKARDAYARALLRAATHRQAKRIAGKRHRHEWRVYVFGTSAIVLCNVCHCERRT
jgi:hypothetical protein